MRINQQKSACCRAPVWRHGQKRRQCQACKRTLSVWPAKRGKRAKRPAHNLLKRYLANKIGSLAAHAEETKLSAQHVQKKVRAARDTQQPSLLWASLPTGPFILVADGLQQTFGQITFTVYLQLLRPIDDSQATILPPFMLPGKESIGGWYKTYARIPKTSSDQIRAIVCDGSAGLLDLANDRGLILQRCHFHFKQSLCNYLRPGRLSRNPALAREIHGLVDVILQNSDDEQALSASERLKVDYIPYLANSKLQTVLRGFCKHWQDYRSYLYYPDLHLPRTSNSAESCVRTIRDLQQRARGWRTPETFLAWVEVVLKSKQTIVCNESKNPQK